MRGPVRGAGDSPEGEEDRHVSPRSSGDVGEGGGGGGGGDGDWQTLK